MKNSFKPLIIIFFVAVFLTVVIQPRAGAKGLVPWRADLAAARVEAKKDHKLLFVEFSASWCGPCQEMARTTWANKNVADALEKMVPVQIDVDSHADVVSEYGVKPIPAYLVIDSDGNIISSGEGYRGPEDFLTWLHGKDGP